MTTTLTISLPEELRAALDEQVASGAYASRDEYIQELIRRDHLLGDRQRLEAELLERSDDSDAIVMDAADIGRMREEFKRRLSQRDGR
jgi:antitoxin ParD1/3/4